MATLVRERVGPLTVDQALTVDEVESRLEQGALAASMLTLDEALVGLPVCTVGAGTAGRVLHGMPVPCSEVLAWHGLPSRLVEGEARPIRIKDDAGRLLAIGTMPIGMDTQAPGVSGQPIAVSKVLVTEALQGGSIANSIEE